MKRALLACALFLACARTAVAANAPLVAIPANHDDDLRLFAPDGSVTTGAGALAAMHAQPALVLWVAGNQFFAMERVVRDFQRSSPQAGVAVGVVTLPPGLEAQAIVAGGFTYGGTAYPGRPDVYATVDLDALRSLRSAGLMERYETYAHNELQIMVARGNPKHIASIDDLVRADVRTAMPNPIDEGIMTSYARPVLIAHGIWERISAGMTCRACQTTPNNWFTAVHHRETPARIASGESDAGIVWKTETQNAVATGAAVEGVSLPAADSCRDQVSYFAGALVSSAHPELAAGYLAFLASAAGQDAYAGLRLRPGHTGGAPLRSDRLFRSRNPVGRVVVGGIE